MRKSTIYSSGILRRQIFKVLALGIAAFFSYSSANAQLLAGTYFINGNVATGGPNYNTFADFFAALTTAGNQIQSPGIELRVVGKTGGYNEQITIPSISGLGPIFGGESRLTIRGDGTANTRLWYAANTSTNVYSVVYLNGADYITFDSLLIENTATSGNRWVVRLNTGSDNIDITNGTIKLANANFGGYGIMTIKGTSTSTWSAGDANNSKNCKIINNTFNGGYYGIYLYGSNSTIGVWPSGNSIVGNTFINPGFYAIYALRQNNIKIDGNDYFGANASSTSAYGMFISGCNNLTITKNRIDAPGVNAMYLSRCNFYNTGLISGQSIIANNSIHGNPRGTYMRGIYISSGSNFDVVYNSVYCGTSLNTTSAWSYTAGIYGSSWTGTANKVLNNVVRFEDGAATYGYATYFNSCAISQFDYNTFYREKTTGALRHYWNGTSYTTLSSFQTGSNTNANSQETDPSFIAVNDLHINGAGLYLKGTPYSAVLKDYDDSTRSTIAPSPGIHEFIPPQNDAGVVSFTQPVSKCPGTNDIEVVVRNFGILPLTSFVIDWKADTSGSTITSGTMIITAAVAIATGADTTIYLDSILMAKGPGYDFKAWTSLPNNVPDESNPNDTMLYSTETALIGDYTIGGVTPDFATFNDAVNGLVNFGVCGSVTFYARGGVYNEQVNIASLMGVDSSKTITFTVDSNNTNPVKIEFASTSFTNDGVWVLKGSSFITINGYDIENTGTSYAASIKVSGDAHHITISNNSLFNTAYNSWNARTLYIDVNGFDGENIHILGNTITGGQYGIFTNGRNGQNASGMDGLRIEDNVVSDPGRYGIYVISNKSGTFSRNNINALGVNSSTFSYGLLISTSGVGYEVEDNVIRAGYYGLFLSGVSGSAAKHGLITNNKVSIGDTATSVTSGFYGFYFSNGGYMDIAHNLFLSQTTRGYTALIRGALNRVHNNIFMKVGGGDLLFIDPSYAVSDMDNNAYQALNGSANGLDYAQGLGFDANGINLDSTIYTNLDSLFTCKDSLVGAGTPLTYVRFDIDGGGRSVTAPTIGPHEFIAPSTFSLGDDQKLCPGDTIYLGAELLGATFKWNTGDTTGILEVTTAGNYDVTVISGCTPSPGAKSAVVIGDASSIAAFIPDSSWMTITFMNNSINATSYMWDFGDSKTSTDMSPVHLYTSPGVYNVCLTATGDCDDNTVCRDVRAWNGVGIEGFDANNAISIYPNPASDILTIETSEVPGNMLNIEISNISGQVIMTSQLNDFNGYAKEQLDISELSKGVYFVKIFTNEVTTAKRLVVQK